MPHPARFAGTVDAPGYVSDIHPETGIRNAPAIRRYSQGLAAVVGRLLELGELPVVVGGDCSILLGCLLACRRRGRFGLLFVDAHPDLLTPETSATGGAAGMDLALATGIGPALLTWQPGPGPLVREEDVVLLGCAEGLTGGTTRTRILVRDRVRIREATPQRIAGEVLDHLDTLPVDGFWIHLDVDVLDPDVMPAVDSPEPGGLAPDELVPLLHPVIRHPGLVGLDVTIYDPARDPEGRAARTLVTLLGRMLRE